MEQLGYQWTNFHEVLIVDVFCRKSVKNVRVWPKCGKYNGYFVLYGCENWSLILREERKLTVCENKVLRIIFGPRRDEVTGDWRRLHNEELNDLYSSPNI